MNGRAAIASRPAPQSQSRERDWWDIPGPVPGRGLLLLVAAAIPTIPFPLFRLPTGSFFIPYAAAPVALLACWSVLRFPSLAADSPTARRCAVLVVALGAWSTLTLLVPGQPQPSHIVSLLFYVVTTAAILALARSSGRSLCQLSTILLVLVTIIVAYGLYQLAAGHSYWFEFTTHEQTGLGTRNSDAFMVATLFPLAFARAVVSGIPMRVRLGAATVGALFVAAVLLSLSRSSTVGMAMAALMTLAAGRKLVPVRVRTLLSVLVLAVGSYLVLQRYFAHHELSLTRFGTVSESTRIPLAQTAVQEGLSHPFTGIGYFRFTATNPWQEDAHDAYLNFFAETGLAGLSLFVCLFAVPIAGYLRAMRRYIPGRTAPQIRMLWLQGFGMLLSIALLAATDTFYKSIYFWIAYFLSIMHLSFLEKATHKDRPAIFRGGGYG